MATTRAPRTLQNNLALTPDEETAIKPKRELVADHELAVSGPAREVPAKEFRLTEIEIAHIISDLETSNRYGVNADHRWPEPLYDVAISSQPLA